MGPPTQHTGLPGWVPHFHGDLQASGSGLCGELQGYFTPDKRNFCLVCCFSEDTSPFLAWEGFRWWGWTCTPRRELVKMVVEMITEDETRCSSTAWWRQLLCWSRNHRFQGGRDLRDGQVQSYSFVDEETEAYASHFASLWPSFLIYKMGTVTSPLQSWSEDLLYVVGPA